MHIPSIPPNPDAADLAILEVRLSESPDSQGKRWLLFLLTKCSELTSELEARDKTIEQLRERAQEGREALSKMRNHLESTEGLSKDVWKYEDLADDAFEDIAIEDG